MACELLSCLDLIETLLCCYNGDGTGDVAVSVGTRSLEELAAEATLFVVFITCMALPTSAGDVGLGVEGALVGFAGDTCACTLLRVRHASHCIRCASAAATLPSWNRRYSLGLIGLDDPAAGASSEDAACPCSS